jgi:hypothetical protein
MTVGMFVDFFWIPAFAGMTVGVFADYSLDCRLRGNDGWNVC